MRWKNLTNFGKFLVVVGIITLATIQLLPTPKEIASESIPILEVILLIISVISWLTIGYFLYPVMITHMLDENDKIDTKKAIMFVIGLIVFTTLVTFTYWNVSFLNIYLVAGLALLLWVTIASSILFALLALMFVIPEFIEDKYGDKINSLTDKVAKFFKNLIFKQ